MAYAYADYESQPTAADKKTRLELHIGEVSALIRPSIGSNGVTEDADHMVEYHKLLTARLRELESAAPATLPTSSPRARSTFTRARPL